MGGPNDNNGNNPNNNGGFLGAAGQAAVHTGMTIGKDIQSGIGALGKVDQAAGAFNVSRALAPFEGGMLNTFKHPLDLWQAGGEIANESSIFGPAAKLAGPAGQVLGAAQAIGNGVQLGNDISKEGPGRAYHDANAYNHAGGMALGASHALLPFLGPYGEAANVGLSVGETAANLGGKAAGWMFGDKAKFDANSVAGGLTRGLIGDQSLGEQARQGVTGLLGNNAVGNTAGVVADVATNVVVLPQNLANTVATGVTHEVSAMADGATHAASQVGDAVDSVLSW